MKRTRGDLRNSSFRPGFRKHAKRRRTFIRVPGPHPRYSVQGIYRITPWKRVIMIMPPPGPLTVREMLNRTSLKSTAALAAACRAGRLPLWRRDRLTGAVYWHRLEFEAHQWWQRCQEVRRPKRSGKNTVNGNVGFQQTTSQKLAELLGIPVIQR